MFVLSVCAVCFRFFFLSHFLQIVCIARFEAELVELEAACIEGGFLNDGVKCGDYKQYQMVTSVSWADAEAKLALVESSQPKNGLGMQYYARQIIGLRKLVVAALHDYNTPESWRKVLSFVSASAPEDSVDLRLAHRNLLRAPEWKTALREAIYHTSQDRQGKQINIDN